MVLHNVYRKLSNSMAKKTRKDSSAAIRWLGSAR